MWISDTSIKRPVFATMVIVSFMVLGVVSMGRLGIDLFPEVNFPFVNVSVVYPGAGPEEVETLVTRPIEDAVAGINGVKRVMSTSTEGFGRVGVELRLEVDPQAAAAEVREKVAAIRDRLPGADRGPDDPALRRRRAADQRLRGRVDAAVRRHAPPGRGRPQAAARPDRRRRRRRGERRRGPRDPGEPRSRAGSRRSTCRSPRSRPGSPSTTSTCPAARSSATARRSRSARRANSSRPAKSRTRSSAPPAAPRSASETSAPWCDGYEDRLSTTRLNGADAVSFSIRKQSGANTVDVQARDRRGAGQGRAELPAAADQGRCTSTPTASRRTCTTSAAHHLRRRHGRARHLHLHARLALDADLGAGAADLGHRARSSSCTWSASPST